MHDPVVRYTLLFAIFGVLIVAGLIGLALFLHRSYWQKLRRAGDSRAKQRELKRRRK